MLTQISHLPLLRVGKLLRGRIGVFNIQRLGWRLGADACSGRQIIFVVVHYILLDIAICIG
jgi:hypothetical protein